MKTITFKNAQDFLNSNHGFLMKQEAINNVMLGVCTGLVTGKIKCPSPIMISVVDELTNQVLAAAVLSPTLGNLVLSFDSDRYLESMVLLLIEQEAVLTGVIGPAEAARGFAELWSQHVGVIHKLAVNLRMYKITSLDPQIKKEGVLRLATDGDLLLATQWYQEFASEVLAHENRSLEKSEQMAKEKIEREELFFLEIDGKLVTMCGFTSTTKDTARIMAVYTPVSYRRQGYASSAVALLSEKLLSEGCKFCVLYTDLANPTSNGIYQKIGYRPIFDSQHYLFEKNS